NVGGEARQIISTDFLLNLPIVDLTQLSSFGRGREALKLAAEERERPFDLMKGPVMRLTLLRLDERDHVLLMTLHHIVSDGWSMGVLAQEVMILYEAFGKGETSPLPELPIQYVDFASWQRQWFQGE